MPDWFRQRFGTWLSHRLYALICLIKGALGKLCNINFTSISACGWFTAGHGCGQRNHFTCAQAVASSKAVKPGECLGIKSDPLCQACHGITKAGNGHLIVWIGYYPSVIRFWPLGCNFLRRRRGVIFVISKIKIKLRWIAGRQKTARG